MNHWNVSTVTNMTYAFNGASSFNQPLNNWNVGNVANMAPDVLLMRRRLIRI
ncbi:BspA family leucine-rich repeat surface protein [Candidatus Saccharibacteria bacterium]|nr:MAG: BspA family leucine-rich repeat surface protein [Candidatus Saccharibacteria bacterium]